MIDTYQFNEMEVVSNVNGVAVNVFVKNTDGSVNQLNSAIVSGGIEANSAGSFSINNVDWLCAQFISEYDPQYMSHIAWTPYSIGNAEFGQALTS